MKLRVLKEKDSKGMLEWMKNKEITRFFQFDVSGVSENSVREFIENAVALYEKKETIHMAIVDEHDEYMGTVSLKNIDYLSKKAEYAISLRACAQGRGIASYATDEILRLAFEEYGLRRVYLNVLADNTKAIRLYEKKGFVYEGEFREHLYLNDTFHSLKWYAILFSEYEQMKFH